VYSASGVHTRHSAFVCNVPSPQQAGASRHGFVSLLPGAGTHSEDTRSDERSAFEVYLATHGLNRVGASFSQRGELQGRGRCAFTYSLLCCCGRCFPHIKNISAYGAHGHRCHRFACVLLIERAPQLWCIWCHNRCCKPPVRLSPSATSSPLVQSESQCCGRFVYVPDQCCNGESGLRGKHSPTSTVPDANLGPETSLRAY
jgi:hypothetical protein